MLTCVTILLIVYVNVYFTGLLPTKIEGCCKAHRIHTAGDFNLTFRSPNKQHLDSFGFFVLRLSLLTEHLLCLVKFKTFFFSNNIQLQYFHKLKWSKQVNIKNLVLS